MSLDLVCKLNLLNLDSNNAVLSSTVEELNIGTVTSALDVGFVSTSGLEEIHNGLGALLGQLLIALGGTSLLVGVTVNCELGVTVNNVLGEILEVSFLTSAELSGTAVEVEGYRSIRLNLNSSEGAILVQIGLTILEVAIRSKLVFEGSHFVLEGGILFLEGSHFVLEGVVLLGGERNRDNNRSDGAVTIPVGLTKVNLHTEGGGRIEDETTSVVGVSVSLANQDLEVQGEVDTLAQAKDIEETGTSGILEVVNSTLLNRIDTLGDIQNTHGHIRNEVPEAELVVTGDGVGNVPHEVTVQIVETELVTSSNSRAVESNLGVVPKTMITQTDTDGRSEPFTEVQVSGEADVTPLLRITDGTDNAVDTSTDTDEHVVTSMIGLIRTMDNLTVFITVVVLLSKSVSGEQEACDGKSSKDFDTFHNTILEINNYHFFQSLLGIVAAKVGIFFLLAKFYATFLIFIETSYLCITSFFMEFKLHSDYLPSGDQPVAIDQLCKALQQGVEDVTLLGVTGSGKTFTMANVIQRLQRPALILSHNKTLAAQLYGEFKAFFPENAVEYFVSYYDYYQPEAYIPVTDTYIEKDLSINDKIDELRVSAASALMSGRRDVIVISSVSCLYGIGNPDDFHDQTVTVRKGEQMSMTRLLYKIVDALYYRTETDFKRGSFRVRGDTIDIYLGGADYAARIEFFGDEVDRIALIDPVSGAVFEEMDKIDLYPAKNFVTSKEKGAKAVSQIQEDLVKQVEYFESIGKFLEAKRLKQRVEYDIEMIKEMGYCPGVENYSRYFDGRKPGQRPFTLIDYFPDDFLVFIDESHVTLPQIRAMYGGDHSRKETLVEYGFRLPAASDNRPLTFDEFEAVTGQTVYVSATPADYELAKSEGLVVEQIVRPTGLLDPPIEVRPTKNQVDDLMEEIQKRAAKDERVLVTTLTKRMAEELDSYFTKTGIRCRYIHSDVDTAERVEIIEDFKNGLFDVLIGVNLLREGLDIPTVSLVAILDADKEGFLRSGRALTQTAGRAARNINGLVIMYADTITESMDETIRETARRRAKQQEYNKLHGITPKQVQVRANVLMSELVKSGDDTTHMSGFLNPVLQNSVTGHVSARDSVSNPEYVPSASELGKGDVSVGLGHDAKREGTSAYVDGYIVADLAAVLQDPVIRSMSREQVEKAAEEAKRKMQKAAAELDFTAAAKFRDEMWALQQYLKVWQD